MKDFKKGEVLVTVSPDEVVGPIKPMNAVNNGPMPAHASQKLSCWREFKALKVPYARSHDVSLYAGYGGSHMGDVTAIFPNFDADENDPSSTGRFGTSRIWMPMARRGRRIRTAGAVRPKSSSAST